MVKIQQSLFLYLAFRLKYLIFNCLLISLLFASTISFAKLETGSFSYEGVTRSYVVFLPKNYNGSTSLPLVVSLHHDGSDAQQYLGYTGMNSVADSAGFIVVYPNAYYSSVAGYRSFNHDAIIASLIPNDPDTRDVGFINALLDTLDSHYSIDLDRIYAAGLSGGGFLAFKMACQFDNRFAAIAAVGPEFSIPTGNNCANLRAVPLLYFFGTNDPIIPYNKNAPPGWYNGEQMVNFWINHNNCFEADTTSVPDLDPNDGCTVEKMTFQNDNDNSKVIFYKINNGGHTWPGTADSPAMSWAGRTTRDINANVEIWNFVKQFRLSQFTTSVNSNKQIPMNFKLSQNYPNPFNPKTTIAYSISQPGLVTLKVFNMLGREIQSIVNELQPAGNYYIDFDASQLSNGVYFYQLKVGNRFSETRKMLYLK